jgi:polar amino acid transport system permease protein
VTTPDSSGGAADAVPPEDFTDALPRSVGDLVSRIARWVAIVAVLVLVAMFVHLLVTSRDIHWHVVAHYFTAKSILLGVVRTIELTAIAMLLGIAIGFTLALMRMSRSSLISGTASLYIWFFRGTPLLVQIIFWYNLASFVPRLSIGIPFGTGFASTDVNSIITPFVAAMLSLGLNEGAYMSEVVRAGITSVDTGQSEASMALGLSKSSMMLRVIFPQAMRVIIPPTGNQAIGMLKSSSLVSVISLPELLYSAQVIYAQNFQTIPLLVVVSIWYLILTTVFSFGQYYIERYYNKGSSKAPPLTPIARLRGRIQRIISGRDRIGGLAT